MDWFVRAFVRASLVWLAAGVSLGVAMAVHPPWIVYRAAHMHMNLLGFVTMMIAGVAYHVIPRLSGTQLWSVKLVWVHLVTANSGLGLMVAAFFLRPVAIDVGTLILAVGGTLSALGAYAFIWNLWRTMSRGAVAERERAVRAPVGKKTLPLAQQQ